MLDGVLISNNTILNNIVKLNSDEEFFGNNLHVINQFINGIMVIIENGVEVIKTSNYLEIMDYLVGRSIDLAKSNYEIIKNTIKFTYNDRICEIQLQ